MRLLLEMITCGRRFSFLCCFATGRCNLCCGWFLCTTRHFISTLVAWRMRYSFGMWKSIYFPSPSLLFWRQRIQFELVEVWYVSRWWKNCATFWRHSELELPTNLRETLWKRTLRVQNLFWKAEDNTFLDENVGVWNISTFFKHQTCLNKQTMWWCKDF